MKKLRDLLVVLGLLTIVGSGFAAYQMWSENAFDAAGYDLWMAGRVSSPTAQRTKDLVTAKIATKKATMLGVAGGALRLFIISAAFWGVPKRNEPVDRLEEVKV